MEDFKGKVAVITGAASGIGRGIAERCVREEMKVVLADIEEASLLKTENELRRRGGSVIAVKTNVAKRADVETLAQKTLDTFGSAHLLFNNAGVGAGGPPWEATWNDWEWVIGVNLWGVIHGIKIFTPIMLDNNTECHIVNTSSIGGLTVGGGFGPYSVTKHAVVALSESLYLTLEERHALVKVSVLCPGFVKTNIINSERNRPVELRDVPVELSPEREAFQAIMDAGVQGGTSPLEVADQVFEAIKEERFYILTHPENLQMIQLRVGRLLRSENPINPVKTIMKTVKYGGQVSD